MRLVVTRRLRLSLGAALLPSFAWAQDAPSGTGDLYVTVLDKGVEVFLDGAPTGQTAPVMLRNVPAGDHVVAVRTECARSEERVQVRTGEIARADLAPEPGTATLTVEGSPAGAVLALDGQSVGTLPWTGGGLSCGPHTLDVTAAGHLPYHAELRLPGWEQTSVRLDLVAEQYGVLVVDVVPLEARVALDGIDLGAGPRTLDRVAVGSHALRAEADGYMPAAKAVEVRVDEASRVSLALELPQQARRVPKGRLVLNAGTTLVGLATAGGAAASYFEGRAAFERYLAEPDDDAAHAIFAEEVRPRQTVAIALGCVSAVALGGSGFLWATTDFSGARVGVRHSF